MAIPTMKDLRDSLGQHFEGNVTDEQALSHALEYGMLHEPESDWYEIARVLTPEQIAEKFAYVAHCLLRSGGCNGFVLVKPYIEFTKWQYDTSENVKLEISLPKIRDLLFKHAKKIHTAWWFEVMYSLLIVELGVVIHSPTSKLSWIEIKDACQLMLDEMDEQK